jgi:four helix bundle protein
MADFRDLNVWQKARKLDDDLDRATNRRAGNRHASLRGQMQRASLSIVSNIAEGSGKGSDKEFVRFLKFSVGSCNELEAQLIIAGDRGFLTRGLSAQLHAQVEEVRKMLYGLIRYLDRPSRDRATD